MLSILIKTKQIFAEGLQQSIGADTCCIYSHIRKTKNKWSSWEILLVFLAFGKVKKYLEFLGIKLNLTFFKLLIFSSEAPTSKGW